jgi:DsbC/DsbD-like thiol-disulfide interchange protein
VRRLLPVAAAVLAAQALLSWSAAGAASPWNDHRVVAVRLLSGDSAGGGELRLGLHYRLAPGWHVYWKHPGDAGAPPEVAVSAGTGEAAVPLQARLLFPAPNRFRLPGGLEALGYEREVVYPLRVRSSDEVPGDSPRLSVSLDYVACAVECIPFHDDLELETTRGPSPEDALLARWEAEVPRPLAAVPGLAARLGYGAGAEPDVVLELTGPALEGARPELFLEPAAGAAFGSPELAAEGRTARFRTIVRPERAGSPPARLAVAWTVTGLRAEGGSAAARIAVTARTEVAAGTETVTGPDAARAALAKTGAGERPGARAVLRATLVGALLALAPTGLVLLLLLGSTPLDARRRSLAPLLAAASMSASLAALQVIARATGVAAPLGEPVTLTALALPAVLLPLLLWIHPAAVARRSSTAIAVLAPLLAAPAALLWLPLAGWSSAPSTPLATAISVGFALPFLAAALVAGRAPALPARAVAALGFLAAATPLWAAYRLALVVPTHRVALVELSWVALALAARAASLSAGAPRAAWCVAAAGAGAAGLWLA